MKKLDLETLKSHYIVSNTPAYLYKYFRRDNSVQKLAEAASYSELEKIFNSKLKKKEKDLDDLVIIYALVVALSYHDYSKVRSFFEKLSDVDIEWLSNIKEIYLSSAEVTQYRSHNILYKPSQKKKLDAEVSNKVLNTSVEPTTSIRKV
ncbi:MAG: hypothetical protein L0229_18685 [Blastocatellia bacterium]|nr:hypothetical protein [Blastocatellia bacterium]